MGLTTWADAPEGKIKKSDVTVANDEWASYEKNVRFLGFIDLDFL